MLDAKSDITSKVNALNGKLADHRLLSPFLDVFIAQMIGCGDIIGSVSDLENADTRI